MNQQNKIRGKKCMYLARIRFVWYDKPKNPYNTHQNTFPHNYVVLYDKKSMYKLWKVALQGLQLERFTFPLLHVYIIYLQVYITHIFQSENVFISSRSRKKKVM